MMRISKQQMEEKPYYTKKMAKEKKGERNQHSRNDGWQKPRRVIYEGTLPLPKILTNKKED